MKVDWLMILAVSLIVGSVLVGMQYYYNNQEKECISNPLTYSAKHLEEVYGYPFQGSGLFIVESNQLSPIIVFNKDNVTVRGV